MRWANVYRLGLKELKSLRYDPVMVFLIVYAFTFSIIAPAKGVKLELKNASVAIIDEDHSQLSRRLSDGLLEPYFQPPVAIGIEDLDRDMDAGRYTFVVDIPPRFEADLVEGSTPTLKVAVDATAMTQAGAGTRFLESSLTEEAHAFLAGHDAEEKQPVSAVTRLLFNPNGDSTWFMSVMQIVNMCTLLGILLTGAALIREREHGTVEHLLVMPLTA